jgi:hypothetical protein
MMKLRTKIYFSVVSQLFLTSSPKNVHSRGFIIYFSISAAWAHVELTMLLKKVMLQLLELYLAFVIILQVSESGLGQYRGMGPYGARHAPKIH